MLKPLIFGSLLFVSGCVEPPASGPLITPISTLDPGLQMCWLSDPQRAAATRAQGADIRIPAIQQLYDCAARFYAPNRPSPTDRSER